ncbi:hypothetical protein MKZ38_009085 [Zalerion maritima]|uniref:Uncharacterized protein n=1 Tax=Zalerion maritima TaxID=339359 RepID=A0AAD5WTN0_9PEZI|nr:hypothetical protein MKZ38_009085 [Zalerion maritima]
MSKLKFHQALKGTWLGHMIFEPWRQTCSLLQACFVWGKRLPALCHSAKPRFQAKSDIQIIIRLCQGHPLRVADPLPPGVGWDKAQDGHRALPSRDVLRMAHRGGSRLTTGNIIIIQRRWMEGARLKEVCGRRGRDGDTRTREVDACLDPFSHRPPKILELLADQEKSKVKLAAQV